MAVVGVASQGPQQGPQQNQRPQQDQRKSLEQMRSVDLYELFECGPADHIRTITKQFRKMALVYHPDKPGGVADCYRYLQAVYNILKDPASRALYDSQGRSTFPHLFESHAADTMQTEWTVPRPQINRAFLRRLMNTQGCLEHRIGAMNMRDYIQKIMEYQSKVDVYRECGSATQCGEHWRLVGKLVTGEVQVLIQARVIRNAAFTGQALQELDFPASHGQQARKYCKKHGLPHYVLDAAFGSTDKIAAFRATYIQQLKKEPNDIKAMTLAIVGGSGLVKVISEHGLDVCPPVFDDLHKELVFMRRHMWKNMPTKWMDVLEKKHRPHPALTLQNW